MFFMKSSRENNKTWRERVFPFIAGVPALALFVVAAIEFFTAWILREPGEDPHLWHIAELVALALLLAFPLLLLVSRSHAKPVLAQFLVLSSVISAIALAPFKPPAAAIVLIGVLVSVTYPNRSALLSTSREGPVSLILLGLSLVMACFLAPVAFREVNYQILGAICQCDIHADLLHWIGSALLMALLVVAGVMASLKRPGWQTLSYIAGSTYVYLGIIAMIVPAYAGSWGTLGGLFAIAAGGVYIVFTQAETVNMRRKARELKRQAEEGNYVWVRSQYPESEAR
jgi:hypothetical protein